MVFSSATFLFAFLPIVITGYYLINEKYRNIWILLSSIVFYAWNEPRLLWVLLFSIVLNYLGAVLIDWCSSHKNKYKNHVLFVVIAANLILLFYFKYFNFTLGIINDLLGSELVSSVILPIGISFFTFQSMSYVIDVWREDVKVQRNLVYYAMYVSMFPQLVAGPIVRYKDINSQINHRKNTLDDFEKGVSRFIVGLFRKVFIADCLAKVADGIFGLEASYRTISLAWIGIIAYTLQIYFDFSGYSDMAIGLGKMLGFDFVENFNFPYISKTITEFWRRWHISLSSFFKDYVYIPLGGNRKAVYRNILIVFLLTGIWHGASYNFIFWGLWHGLFNLLEKWIGKNRVESAECQNHVKKTVQSILGICYTMIVVMVGWVFFRAESMAAGWDYLQTMFGIYKASAIPFTYSYFVKKDVMLISLLALVWSTPLFRVIGEKCKNNISINVITPIKYIGLVSMLGLCMLRIASGTYSAFIYFQF